MTFVGLKSIREKTVTSVLFYLCGDRSKASSRVRGYWIAEDLEERGTHCSLEPRHSKLAMLRFALRIPFHEVVVFQKTYSRWHVLLDRLARLLGKKTILDLDDAPSRTNHPVTLHNVEFMMQNVSAITVGSKVLFDYTSQYSDSVHLIPSSIRLKYYQPMEKKDNLDTLVCLGWIGNGKHYKQDLISILKEPLIEIAKTQPIRFKLIGACGEQELYDCFSNIRGLEFDVVDQIEWSNPIAVSSALRDVDIGLYPLLSKEFNQYKCGFKALEYMAMKIPVVSSKVAENREIIEDGVNGFFADSSNKWKLSILKLITHPHLRLTMGESGRKLVVERYSVKRMAREFFDVIR